MWLLLLLRMMMMLLSKALQRSGSSLLRRSARVPLLLPRLPNLLWLLLLSKRQLMPVYCLMLLPSLRLRLHLRALFTATPRFNDYPCGKRRVRAPACRAF
jgi:hypothetical protein